MREYATPSRKEGRCCLQKTSLDRIPAKIQCHPVPTPGSSAGILLENTKGRLCPNRRETRFHGDSERLRGHFRSAYRPTHWPYAHPTPQTFPPSHPSQPPQSPSMLPILFPSP